MPSDRLEELLRVLEMYSYDEGRNRIVEALGAVLDLHREAFERTLGIVRERAPELVKILQSDPVVGGILEGYDLVESDIGQRVEGALTRVGPLLKELGAQARVVELSGSSIRVQVIRGIHGDDVSVRALTGDIEKSLREDAPELTEITVTSATNLAYAETPHSWLPLVHRFELEGGELHKIQIFDQSVLACDVNGKIFVFYDRCPAGGSSLESSSRDGAVITCACHGHRFDLASGRCLDRPNLTLELLSVSLDDTAVKVAL
ncbi:MAG: Rieske (2Fe-2S) protein [Acidobacteriota bacterium]